MLHINSEHLREHASADPYAGTVADNGKPIWTAEQAGYNLSRSNQDWTDGRNYGEVDDGVLNFGFWDLESLLSSYYVNADGTTAFTEAYNYDAFVAFSAEQMALARDTMGMWDDLVAISFQETAVADADITFGNTDDGPYSGAYAYLPFGDRLDEVYEYYYGFQEVGRLSGDVWINTQETANFQNFDKGYYANFAIMHEIGHALGLSHAGQYNATNPDGSANPADYAGDAYFYQDSNQYTAMSYFGAEDTGGMWIDFRTLTYGYSSTPMVHDIVAVQQIYGADMTTRTGDTVYGFNSNADRAAFRIDDDGTFMPIFTIWDAGGNDTLDLSGYDTPSVIDLNEGAFSSAGGTLEIEFTLEEINAARDAAGRVGEATQATIDAYMGLAAEYGITSGLYQDNIAIAYGAVIENAIGGGGDDIIIGNKVANVLKGNGGNDDLFGGDGNDTLFGGAGDDFLNGGAGKDELIGGAGDDVFIFEDISKDKIRDFETGKDQIDLSAFAGVSASSVKISGGKVFVDTDGDGKHDLDIVVQGSKVNIETDFIFGA